MEFKRDRLVSQIKTLNYNDLKIFLIPVIIFSIYLGVFKPGIATIDTFNQLHQIASGHFTNWHPFFHTFIEMLCLRIYPSTLSVCILQILVFSLMWTAICKYNRDDNAQSNTTFKIQNLLNIVMIFLSTPIQDYRYLYANLLVCYLLFIIYIGMLQRFRDNPAD